MGLETPDAEDVTSLLSWYDASFAELSDVVHLVFN